MTKPHPCNVPGPFYVEDGCCTACNIPFEIAPEGFSWTEGETHCFVASQPESAGALDRMLQALWSSEFECIRYRGSDPAVLRRLAEMDAANRSDVPPPSMPPVFRDRAVFRPSRAEDDGAAMADRFRAYLEAQRTEYSRDSEGELRAVYRVRPRRRWSPRRVILSWYWGSAEEMDRPLHFHQVTFGGGNGRGIVRLDTGFEPALRGLALLVHEWLRDEDCALDIEWLSADERRKGKKGLHVPL